MTRKTNGPAQSAANLKALRVPDRQARPADPRVTQQRAAIAAQIGKVKADQGGEVFSAAREEEVLDNVLKANKGPLEEVTSRPSSAN